MAGKAFKAVQYCSICTLAILLYANVALASFGFDTNVELPRMPNVGIHGENVAADIAANLNHGRNLLQNNRPPAWRGRFDPTYLRSYMAPAITENKCDADQDCSMISGDSYPYDQYVLNPTKLGDPHQPVMKIVYPQVSCSYFF